MKVYDAAAIRNVAAGRARRMRQDAAGLGAAVRRRRGQPARQGRRRHDRHRLRRRRNRPQAHALVQPRLRSNGRRPRSTSSTRRASRNFLSDARSALRVAECRARLRRRRRPASRSRPRRLWAEAADELDLPRIVVVNRLERERASLERTLESLRAAIEPATIIPIQLPIGEEESFTGVVDLVAQKALTFADRRQRQDDRAAMCPPTMADAPRRRASS